MRPPLALALALVLAGLAGCSGGSSSKTPAPSRFDAVQGAAESVESAERWCDAAFPPGHGPRFELPGAAPARPGGRVPVLAADRWVWVNVWATWCAPCRREMPLVERFAGQLKHDTKLDVWYVSIDESAADLARFLRDEADTAPGASVRLNTPGEFQPWLKHFWKDASEVIPAQILVAPGGTVRCVRSGSIADGDFPTIHALTR